MFASKVVFQTVDEHGCVDIRIARLILRRVNEVKDKR